MRRFGNILTIAITVVIVIASFLFADLALPVLTDNQEHGIREYDVTLTNPQEIIEAPAQVFDPAVYFPSLCEGRVQKSSNTYSDKQLQAREQFLNRVSESVEILFGVQIDDVIMEAYTQVWVPNSHREEYEILNIEDLFSVDVIFTDVRSDQWRITASGYADNLFYFSCIQWTEDSTGLPPCFTSESSVRQIRLSDKQEDEVERFWNKITTLPQVNTIINQGLFYPIDTAFMGKSPEVVWYIHFVSDDKYLISGFVNDVFTPYSYIFMDVGEEMPNGFYWPV